MRLDGFHIPHTCGRGRDERHAGRSDHRPQRKPSGKLPVMKALLAFLILTGPAFAQTCEPRPDMAAKLADKYGESMRFGGLQKTTGGQAVLEVWASPETGTYTVLLSHANGLSCIIAVGTDFFEAIPAEEPAGNPL